MNMEFAVKFMYYFLMPLLLAAIIVIAIYYPEERIEYVIKTEIVEVERIVEKVVMIDECQGYGQKETSRRAVDYQFANEVRIQIVCKGE